MSGQNLQRHDFPPVPRVFNHTDWCTANPVINDHSINLRDQIDSVYPVRLKADAALGEVFDQTAPPSPVPAPRPAYNDPDEAFTNWDEDLPTTNSGVAWFALWSAIAVLGIGLTSIGSWPLNGLGGLGIALTLAGLAGLVKEVLRRD
ncbi:hypothetical protein M3B43_12020 [Nesterenkonia massiliensis]|uniref:DUF2530 domain-containing protein n=1 Tax=Nesterenkonia massiliensis TaxID=1232429 RepID=A0ABT2HTK4_9MICC|nr:hypothetical protein [Nesterenkonia massiliensis]MCT1608024.1 hypothetical protein [Nesterenkonia massiliensis]